MQRFIRILAIPVFIFALAIFIYPEARRLPEPQLLLLMWLPVIVAVATLILSFRFNRSRMFFTVLSVVLAYAVLVLYPTGIGNASTNIIWSALCIFLPMNMLVFAVLKERGTFTLWGISRFAFLLLPFLTIVAFSQWYPSDVFNLIHHHWFRLELLSGVPFSEISLTVMITAFVVLNGRMFIKPGAQNGALFVGLVAVLAMLYFKGEPATQAVFATAMVLMLIAAVVQESWSMAYIDQLTGLPGRRALEEEMLKLGSNYSIAMIDIDHFKKFNDRHGHDAGDQVLNMVASRIKQSLKGGRAFRYGGEEFTILLPGKSAEQSLGVLETVRETVSDSRFQLRESRDRRQRYNGSRQSGKKVNVTISAGVAARDERLSSTIEVIKAADKALYKAKKQGRNRVCKQG